MRMAKKNGWGLAIAGAVVATSALLNRRNRKKAEKASEEARQNAEAASAQYQAEIQNPSPAADISSEQIQSSAGEGCPNCGTINSSNAVSCSFCSAKLKDSGYDELDTI